MATKKHGSYGPEAAALVVAHWKWADGFARRQARKVSFLDEDEVAGEALLALVRVAQRFTPGKGVAFRTFAIERIRGAIKDYQRRLDTLGRWERPAQKAGRITKWARRGGVEMLRVHADVCDLAASDHSHRLLAVDPEQESVVLRTQVRAVLIAGMELLPWRQREVIERVHFRGQTLKTVGKAFGITESRACQIAALAYRALAEHIEDPRGED